MRQYTLFWNYGLRQVIEGASPQDALNRAGILQGELVVMSFWRMGDHKGYTWNDSLRRWVDSTGRRWDYCALPRPARIAPGKAAS